MKNRVYGLIGIGTYMANWNADFTGRPKTTSDGSIFGSDKALKYSMRKYWTDNGEKVLFFRTLVFNQIDKSKPKKGKKSTAVNQNTVNTTETKQYRSLSESYQDLFNSNLDQNTEVSEVLNNLFKAIDVMNFGATFAEKGQSLSVTGAVQIGQGINKYSDAFIDIQNIDSPFRNAKNNEAQQTSGGTQAFCKEAHYLYPFTINPISYNEFIKNLKDFEGYTKDAYGSFKNAARFGATALNTATKIGCENELALFVELKKESKIYLPNLDRFVNLEENDNNVKIYDFSKLSERLISFVDDIDKVDLYINPDSVQVHSFNLPHSVYDIFSGKRIGE